MSAIVGKIINIKEWKSQKQAQEKVVWQNKRKIYLVLRILLAVTGAVAFGIDLLWLKVYFMGWLGILALFPLFLSNFIYFTEQVEVDGSKGYIYISRQNKFYTKIIKISLKGIIAIEENTLEKNPRNKFLIHLKNDETYHLPLPKDETQIETLKKLIIANLGLGFSSEHLHKSVS